MGLQTQTTMEHAPCVDNLAFKIAILPSYVSLPSGHLVGGGTATHPGDVQASSQPVIPKMAGQESVSTTQ